jgi:hypothetical protein
LVLTFLRGGLPSPRPDRDTTVAAVEDSRTYWILGRRVRPVFSPVVSMEESPSTLRSEATYAGKSCLNESVGTSPSAKGHFGRRSPAIDHVCRGTASRCGEGVMHGEDKGGKVTTLSTSPSPEDADLGESSIPCLFAARSVAHHSLSPFLLTRPCFLTRGMPRLLPVGVRGRVGIPRLTTAAPETLCKIMSGVKR